jgi:ribosomal protein S18 acetylase RimI-like enzyme
MHIRTAEIEDLSRIRQLYQEVSRKPGGIPRAEHEVTDEYVRHFLEKSVGSGLILVAEHPEKADTLIAEMHAYQPGPEVSAHVLSDLTIVVHPDFQGRKIGRTLFTIFLEEVGLNRPEIGKVELIARESHEGTIRFYQSFGFLIEGRLEMRIKTPDGHYEAEIPMGWQNPNYEF